MAALELPGKCTFAIQLESNPAAGKLGRFLKNTKQNIFKVHGTLAFIRINLGEIGYSQRKEKWMNWQENDFPETLYSIFIASG